MEDCSNAVRGGAEAAVASFLEASEKGGFHRGNLAGRDEEGTLKRDVLEEGEVDSNASPVGILPTATRAVRIQVWKLRNIMFRLDKRVTTKRLRE